jgi:hypothetical protein
MPEINQIIKRVQSQTGYVDNFAGAMDARW